ncbi:MAG: hypothetical protein JKY94_11555 [Rhodobacteraceae bacterium]|nr:hypothetical protein [Paracoccaceae bacterium]
MTFPWMATIGRYFAAIGKGLVFMGESSSRFRKLEKLQALSDAELAKRGMKREDIVRVVFADSFWM